MGWVFTSDSPAPGASSQAPGASSQGTQQIPAVSPVATRLLPALVQTRPPRLTPALPARSRAGCASPPREAPAPQNRKSSCSMPHLSSGAHARPIPGFLHVSRRALAVGAAAVTFWSVSSHDLPAQAATVREVEIQEQLQTVSIKDVTPVAAERDAFGITEFTVVQWPLAPSSKIASHFGYRSAPCGACSSNHLGVDFDPGAGTAIRAIADGVVTEVGNPSGELGVHVVIQHVVNGATVSSVYGHMQFGSLGLSVGDRVVRGQVLGAVGSSGLSTGPHLHLEIRDASATPIDPLAWLRANVTQEWGT